MGLGDGTGALQDLAELDELFDQLSQSYANRGMDGSALSLIDLDKLARQLGDEAAVDARTLAELEKALRETGYLKKDSTGNYRPIGRAPGRERGGPYVEDPVGAGSLKK